MQSLNQIKHSIWLWFVGNHFRPVPIKNTKGETVYHARHPARKTFVSNNFKSKKTAQKACDILNRKQKKGLLDLPKPKSVIAMRSADYK